MRTPPPATSEQFRLAALLSINIVGDSFDTAAARLLDAVAETLGFEPEQPSSLRQRAFAESLGENVAMESKRIASAKIGDRLLALNQEAIAELNLKPGDRVVRVSPFEYDGEKCVLEQEFIVSSIQPNGRVFFKGGNGQGAWPTQLRKGKSAP